MRATFIFLFTLVCHVARNSEIAKPFYTVIDWMPLCSVLSQMFVIVHYYCKEADFHSTCILAGVCGQLWCTKQKHDEYVGGDMTIICVLILIIVCSIGKCREVSEFFPCCCLFAGLLLMIFVIAYDFVDHCLHRGHFLKVAIHVLEATCHRIPSWHVEHLWHCEVFTSFQ